MALTRDQILARKIAGKTEAYKIEDDEVIIRGLSLAEVHELREIQAGDGLAASEHFLISCGLVDPVMTVADVAVWASQDEAGLMTSLSTRIGELSGMGEGAGKSGVPRTRRKR